MHVRPDGLHPGRAAVSSSRGRIRHCTRIAVPRGRGSVASAATVACPRSHLPPPSVRPRHGDVLCARPAAPRPRGHGCGRPVVSSTAVDLRLTPPPSEQPNPRRRRPPQPPSAVPLPPPRRPVRAAASARRVCGGGVLLPRRWPPVIPSTRGLVRRNISHGCLRGRGRVRGGDVLRGRTATRPRRRAPPLPSPCAASHPRRRLPWRRPRAVASAGDNDPRDLRAAPRPRWRRPPRRAGDRRRATSRGGEESRRRATRGGGGRTDLPPRTDPSPPSGSERAVPLASPGAAPRAGACAGGGGGGTSARGALLLRARARLPSSSRGVAGSRMMPRPRRAAVPRSLIPRLWRRRDGRGWAAAPTPDADATRSPGHRSTVD